MNRKTIILTTLLLVISANVLKAQRPWKEYLVPGAAMFVSGMLEGTNEAMLFHYKYGFKNRFPNASDKFWNPAISWKNKYKNFDPTQGPAFIGSTDVFVSFTDGYHLLRVSRVFMDMGAMTYCINKNHSDKTKYRFVNWKTVAQDFLVLSAIRTIGFHVTYSWMFQQSPEAFNGN